jgi:hypothetical protein
MSWKSAYLLEKYWEDINANSQLVSFLLANKWSCFIAIISQL